MSPLVRWPAYAAAPVLVALAASVLPWVAGRDPALAVLRARVAERDPDAAALVAVRQELGLPDGPVEAAMGWLGGLARGDLGTSWVSGDPVGPLVLAAAGASLALTVAAVATAVLVACGLTALALEHPLRGWGGSRPGERSVRGPLARRTATAAAALPELLLAAGLVWLAALGPGWPHTAGWSGPGDLVLPALALGLPLGGVLAVVMQQAALASLGEPWVRTWAGAGRPGTHVTRAAFRRAVAVVAPLLGLALGGVLGGAVLVETLFGIPGLGRVALGAATGGDLPVVQVSLLALVAAGLVAGLAGDALRAQVQRAPVPVGAAPSRRTGALTVGGAAGLVLLALLVLGLPRDPSRVSLDRRHAEPSIALPLGADHLGRDLLARLAHGAVVTVGPAVLITAVAFALALLLSARSSGGRLLGLVGNALPAVVTGLLTVVVLGPGTSTAVLAVAAVAWIPLATHARVLVAEQRGSEHVAAARLLGAGPWRLHLTEVLPAVVGPLSRHAAARVAHACLALTGLAFLGLGAQPPSPSWGLLLHDGLPQVAAAPLPVVLPALALVLVGLAVDAGPRSGRAPDRRGRERTKKRVLRTKTAMAS